MSTSGTPEPVWTGDERLDDVYRRAASLRRRRALVLAGGSTAVALLSIAVVVALVVRPAPRRTLVHAGPGRSVASDGVTTLPTSSTTATAPPPPATRQSTGRSPLPASAIVAGPATTSPPMPVTTTAVSPPACGSHDLDVVTTTDHATYARAEPVGVTTTAKNVSSRSCQVERNQCGNARVDDSSGTTIWSARGACPAYSAPVTLSPGQSATAHVEWDQKTCTAGSPPWSPCDGPPPPAGRYDAIGTWVLLGNSGPAITGSPAAFDLSG